MFCRLNIRISSNGNNKLTVLWNDEVYHEGIYKSHSSRGVNKQTATDLIWNKNMEWKNYYAPPFPRIIRTPFLAPLIIPAIPLPPIASDTIPRPPPGPSPTPWDAAPGFSLTGLRTVSSMDRMTQAASVADAMALSLLEDVYPRLVEFLHFDIQSTRRNHIASTPSPAIAMLCFN